MKAQHPTRRRSQALVLLWLVLAAPACHAYIDPNSGNLLYQLLLPLILALSVGWRYLKTAMIDIATRACRAIKRLVTRS